MRHCRKRHKEEAEKPEKVGDYKCDVCDKSFKEKQVLVQHKKGVHNKPLCRFCGKPQSRLKTHEAKCETKTAKKTERKKKRCPNCSSEVINLTSHVKICLKKKTEPPTVQTPSMTHQEKK